MSNGLPVLNQNGYKDGNVSYIVTILLLTHIGPYFMRLSCYLSRRRLMF
ncbi:Hypothetical protein ETEE_p1045 (plasmid) [Edwardsiella anguillarum ET080813]|uniref:Uncharacterized protein n=1 Tax=Edwardsiella anguillarum ET080813 TaxID=667120 RepID=A0A076LRP1_9GAMM|nr:Hypothetical protein ETEE_p1045 [Edwardsiella anguillarum ET080813]